MLLPLASAERPRIFSHAETLALTLFAATAWIVTHRYHGIWHDGVLYAGQALFRLDPTPFTKDLFFAYGSQDSFTAFTGIYALAIQALGLPTASMVLLGIAHLVWFGAICWLLRGILSGIYFWLALVLVTVLPGVYGSFDIFSYGETFLTARIWAEPLSLLAVASLIYGRTITAIIWVTVAAVMHPVIALPAALLIFFLAFPWRWQLALAIAGICIAFGLSLGGVAPFDKLTLVMDPVWHELSVNRSPFVFLDQWRPMDYREPVFLALLLAVAALTSPRETRRLWGAALGVLVTGLGIAVLAIWWPGVLLIQLQTWRVLWLIKILAIAASGILIYQSESSPFGRLLLGALVACAVTIDSTGLVTTLPVAVLLVLQRKGFEPTLPPWVQRTAWVGVSIIVGEKTFWGLYLASISLDFTASSFASYTLTDRLFVVAKEAGWILMPVLLIGLWQWTRKPSAGIWPSLVCSLILAYFAAHWHRTNATQYEEDKLWEKGHEELAHIIQSNQLTYWEGGHPKLWFILRRGSYASNQQAAGIIFSRDTALEADRRLGRLEKQGLTDVRFDWIPSPDDTVRKAPLDLDGLTDICLDPILDYVILPRLIAGTNPVIQTTLHKGRITYYLYACQLLRASSGLSMYR